MSQEVSAGVKNYSTFTGKLNLLRGGEKNLISLKKDDHSRWHQSSLNISLSVGGRLSNVKACEIQQETNYSPAFSTYAKHDTL